MTQFRFVTIGKLSEEFSNHVRGTYPELEIKRANDKNELLRLLPESNAYAGFCELGNADVAHLKWIHSFGAGVDLFLKNMSIVQNKILISRTSGQMGRQMGEYCLAHVLNWYQEIKIFDSAQKEGKWNQISTRRLFESNVLILGTGNIGSEIAKVLRPLVNSITGVNGRGQSQDDFYAAITIGDVSNNYDVVINCLPETDVTKGLLGISFFEQFEGCIFINTGRGSAVVSTDLIQSLNKGHLSAAVLDVFEKEPLDKQSELWKHPFITITPHVSGVTTIEDVMSSFASAYQSMKEETQDKSFVKYDKGY